MPKSSGKENRNQEIEKLLKELKRQVDSLQKNESARAVRPELRKLRAALRHLERLCSKGQVGDMGDVNPAGGAVPWIPSKAGESRKPLPAMVVAGDDAGFRKSIRMIFGEGFRISEARQGSQALELAMREKPSLLISGLVMSDMSGLDLWRKLRSIPALSLVPLLLLSDTEASQVAAAAGASLPESRRYSPPVNQLIARVGKIMAFQQMAHQNIPPPLLFGNRRHPSPPDGGPRYRENPANHIPQPFPTRIHRGFPERNHGNEQSQPLQTGEISHRPLPAGIHKDGQDHPGRPVPQGKPYPDSRNRLPYRIQRNQVLLALLPRSVRNAPLALQKIFRKIGS